MRTLVKLLIVLFTPIVIFAQAGPLPTPASVFGFEPGADNRLATYDQVVDYLKRVDAASDRVMLVDAGTTSLGRRFTFALVSSPANLKNINRLREINRRLAHPADLTDAEAARLAQEGRPFVHIDGGLHSTEVAAPQHVPFLLDDLLRRATEPAIAKMLDDVVLMLWPTINPDGHQMVAENQEARNAADGAAGGRGGRGGGLDRLYQEYVGHDNNRDAYMLNMVESRALEFAWRQWEPQIIYVHHQSAPFPTRIWLPPFAEPIATHAPYLMSRQVNMIGMAIALELEERGKVGATHMGTGYDAWYPGYIDYLPMFKNISAFWTETQGNGAAPVESAIERFGQTYRDLRPQSLYASPWTPGTWRLRDAVEYMAAASFATIEFASRYRESVLLNRYRAGRDQIAQGRKAGGPYGWVIPADQRDPVSAVELLRRLAFSGVRVFKFREESTVNGFRYPAGTWVIPADQEFAALAREVLEVQRYPDLREFPGGPPEQPYDAAGWTLPLAMGVQVITATAPINQLTLDPIGPAPMPVITPRPYESAVADAAPFDSVPGAGFDVDPSAKAIVPPAGRITGTGDALALDPAGNNTFRAMNRAWKAGLDVRYVAAAGTEPARYVLTGLSDGDQQSLVQSLALVGERTSATSGSPLRRPRIGLFDRPTSMDHGWTRWVLDSYEFEYVPVTGADIQAGNLSSRIDVLLITDEAGGIFDGGGGRGGPGGGAPGAAPVGAAAGAGQGTGRAGAPAQAGGANETRIRALDEFIRGGGRLVCFNRSSTFMIDQLKLPVRNTTRGITREEFFANGSLLRVTTNQAHPVMAGMPAEAAVFFDGGPVFETTFGFKGTELAGYQVEGSPLLSGYLLGEKYLQGRKAALEVEHGAGKIVLLGFRPQWRGQPFGTFRVFFNAIVR